MRRKQQISKSKTNRIGRRQLGTEQLERRVMLAADLMSAGAAFGAVGSGCESSAAPAYVNVSSSVASSGVQSSGLASTSNGKGGDNDDSQQSGQGQSGQGQSGQNQAQSELSTFEIESLLHMREEEKLARDVYNALGDQWDVPIFGNIAEAESQHMESMLQLIDKYGLEDPVGDNAPGEFTNPAFETLYTDLVEMGSESLLAAYKVGALIEELDIVDLQNALEDVDHDDIEEAYENLLRGSENHLRSFAAQIAAAGSTYDAQYLSQAEFDAIANSPMETGTDQGNNQGQGGEQGQGGQQNDNGNSQGHGKQDRMEGKEKGSKQERTERPEQRPSRNDAGENVSRGDQDRDKDQDRDRGRDQGENRGREQDRDRDRDRDEDRDRGEQRDRGQERDRDRDSEQDRDQSKRADEAARSQRERVRDRLFSQLGSRQRGRRF